MTLRNLLDRDLGNIQFPQMPVKYAAGELKRLGEGIHTAPGPLKTSNVIAQLTLLAQGHGYTSKGPWHAAKELLEPYASMAVSEGYPVDNPIILDALLGLIMALATTDEVGKDTTGTQMGNYRGSWRGGGFS